MENGGRGLQGGRRASYGRGSVPRPLYDYRVGRLSRLERRRGRHAAAGLRSSTTIVTAIASLECFECSSTVPKVMARSTVRSRHTGRINGRWVPTPLAVPVTHYHSCHSMDRRSPRVLARSASMWEQEDSGDAARGMVVQRASMLREAHCRPLMLVP